MASGRVASGIAALGLLAPFGVAQTVWNVPDGAPLQPFVTAATPGDILQLANEHPPFVLDKGLVIRGGGIAQTRIRPDPLVLPLVVDTTLVVPPGQEARLLGITFAAASTATTAGFGQRVVVQGDASFTDCAFESRGVGPAALAPGTVEVRGGSVALLRCQLRSFSAHHALLVTGGICSLSEVTLLGANHFVGATSTNHPSTALRIAGGSVIASQLLVHGGSSTCALCGSQAGQPGVLAGANELVLSDSSVFGGDSNVLGGDALHGGSGTRLARNVLVGGSGPTVGLPTLGAVQDEPGLVGLRAAAPPQVGATFTAVATTAVPSGWLLCFAALRRDGASVPWFAEPALLPLGAMFLLTTQAPAATGSSPFSVLVPAVPSLQGAAFWLQVLQFDGLALHASPVVGGTIL